MFYKKQCTYNPQGLVYNPKKQKRGGAGNNYNSANTTNTSEYENYPTDILFFDKDKPTLHPTQKPIDLLRYLILTYTNEGDIVLDNCMGSGTTAVACIKEKRHFIGFELNENYYNIACNRIIKEQSQIILL